MWLFPFASSLRHPFKLLVQGKSRVRRSEAASHSPCRKFFFHASSGSHMSPACLDQAGDIVPNMLRHLFIYFMFKSDISFVQTLLWTRWIWVDKIDRTCLRRNQLLKTIFLQLFHNSCTCVNSPLRNSWLRCLGKWENFSKCEMFLSRWQSHLKPFPLQIKPWLLLSLLTF